MEHERKVMGFPIQKVVPWLISPLKKQQPVIWILGSPILGKPRADMASTFEVRLELELDFIGKTLHLDRLHVFALAGSEHREIMAKLAIFL